MSYASVANEKAPMSSRGFGNTSDSAESKIRVLDDLILAQAPNLYNTNRCDHE